MQLDQKKYARQKELFKAWLDNLVVSPVRAGIIMAVTGFGKTFIAIMGILDMNKRHPDRTTIVIVPTIKLKEDWEGYWRKEDDGSKTWIAGHIEKHNLQNVRVFVVNTFVKFQDWRCDFFVLDEAHHYANVDAQYFSTVIKITQYRFGLALSATLNEIQIEFFKNLGWNVVGEVTEEEAEREEYTSKSIVYNLGIPLTPLEDKFNEEINNQFKYWIKHFDFDFKLMVACNVGDNVYTSAKLRNGYQGMHTGKSWRSWWGKMKGWDGQNPNHTYSPVNIAKYAAQGMAIVQKRKDRWHNAPSKLFYVEQLINKFPHLKTMTFCETSVMADKIVERLGKRAVAYHTNLETVYYHPITGHMVPKPKMTGDAQRGRTMDKEYLNKGYIKKSGTVRKKEALQAFCNPNSNVNVASTVRALDEGFDLDTIQFILMVAYNSTPRQDIQRSGRGKRKNYDDLKKKTLIVNLYMMGTQEEQWLRHKQVGKRMVRWVKSVDEITTSQSIKLSSSTRNVNLKVEIENDSED